MFYAVFYCVLRNCEIKPLRYYWNIFAASLDAAKCNGISDGAAEVKYNTGLDRLGHDRCGQDTRSKKFWLNHVTV